MFPPPSIPFFEPDIGPAEINEVVATLESGWLTTGERARTFERKFAEYVGAEHAIAVSSCTAGLHLALVERGIGPGDDVLVPTMTFAATAAVVIHTGARPVLVDCDPDTLLVDPELIAALVGPATRAVMPVHYGGQACDMAAIETIAAEHGLALIEDAAHALPAADQGRPIGTIGDATVFSFYANKTITTAEGGMITTRSDITAQRLRTLSMHGMDQDAWKRYRTDGSWDYAVVEAGFKYNLPDVLAAIGLHQLDRADDMRAARSRIAARYNAAFEGFDGIAPLAERSGIEHAWHLYVIRLDVESLQIDRSQFISMLREQGIGASVHYRPLHLHPLYANRFGYKAADFPNASRVFPRLVSLPIYPTMSEDATERVISVVQSLVREHRT